MNTWLLLSLVVACQCYQILATFTNLEDYQFEDNVGFDRDTFNTEFAADDTKYRGNKVHRYTSFTEDAFEDPSEALKFEHVETIIKSEPMKHTKYSTKTYHATKTSYDSKPGKNSNYTYQYTETTSNVGYDENAETVDAETSTEPDIATNLTKAIPDFEAENRYEEAAADAETALDFTDTFIEFNSENTGDSEGAQNFDELEPEVEEFSDDMDTNIEFESDYNIDFTEPTSQISSDHGDYWPLGESAEDDLSNTGITGFFQIIKPHQPVQPPELTKPQASKKLLDPTKLSKTSKPSKPTQILEPFRRPELMKPSEPMKCNKPIETRPLKPNKPALTTEFLAPKKPSESAKPLQTKEFLAPTKLLESSKSLEPIKPLELVKPLVLTKPLEPTKDLELSKLAESVKLVEPTKLLQPTKPYNSTKPFELTATKLSQPNKHLECKKSDKT